MRGLGFRAQIAVLLAVAFAPLLPGNAGALTGGTSISISTAPWAVAIMDSTTLRDGGFTCTGVIIDALHVATTRLCVLGASPQELYVIAGVSNFDQPQPGDAKQTRVVASFRLHPAGTGTNLAVLQLASPLTLDGAHTAAVTPHRSNWFATDQTAVVASFGAEKQGQPPTGSLSETTERVHRQGTCGGFNLDPPDTALHLCASSPVAGVCLGDSGAGLVTPGPHPVLLGILVATLPLRNNCVATGVYTYVGAAEVWRWLAGANHPPLAPQNWSLELGGGIVWRVGDDFQCVGDGVGRARTRYEVLLAGRSVRVSKHGINYTITRADIGKRFTCKGRAWTDGGTSVDQWTSLPVKP